MTKHNKSDHYRALIDNAPDAIFILDADKGKFVDCNKTAEKLFKLSRKQILQASVDQISPKTVYGQKASVAIKKKLKEVMDGKDSGFEWIHLDSKGKEIPCEVKLVRLPPYDKKLIRGSVIDISEKIKTEAALRESQKRLSLIFNSTTDAISLHKVIPNNKLKLIEVNAAFRNGLEAAGITEDKYIGGEFVKTQTKILGRTTKRAKELEAELLKAAKTKKVNTFVDELPLPDGNSVFSEVVVTPVFDTQNSCTHVMATARDITHERIAETILKESEERLRIALKASELGTFDWMPKEGSVIWDNKMHEMFELDPESDVDRNDYFFSLVHPEDKEDAMWNFQRALDPKNKDSTFSDQNRMILSNDIVRHIVTYGVLIRNSNGEVQRVIGTCKDVTASVLTQKQIEANEERYRTVFNLQYQFMAILSPKGRVLRINDLPLKMQGGTREDYIGKLFWKLPAWKGLKGWPTLIQERVERALEERDPVFTEDQYLGGDGEIRYAEASYYAVRDVAGLVKYIMVQANDITEHKLAESSLIESEERYRSIVQDQTEMIARWKMGGIRTYVNDAYCKAFSKTREELLGTSFFPLIAKGDLKAVQGRLKKITPKNPISTATHEVLLADGSTGWQEWTDRGFFDKSGNIIEYQSVGRDVTERKLAEQKIAHYHELLLSTEKLAGVGSWRWDYKTGEVQWSPEMYRQYGLTEEDVPKPTFDIAMSYIHPDDQQKGKENIKDIEAGILPKMEYRLVLPDGAIRWVSSHGSTVFDQNGKLVEVYGFVQDITEQKHAEQELQNAFAEVNELKAYLEQENIYLREEIKEEHNFEDIVFASPKFREVLNRVEQVAGTDATVLILGETGTGKELIARAVHNVSGRGNRPLVKINCATLPKDLIESELFGHEKGAFTGAMQRKIGKFELADGGTIFLDEVGELPSDLQAKLLRVLQEGELERIGGTELIHVDVRVVAATNRNLEEMIKQGDFRSDLYYRLNVFPVSIPPLRDRIEDIPLLIHHFVNKYSQRFGREINTVPKVSLDRLQSYNWPGNIRELENLVERAIILSTDGVLNFENLGESGSSEQQLVTLSSGLSLKQVEHAHILRTLRETRWVITGPNGAAKQLGLKPSTLRDRMKKLGIRRPEHQ